jgi:cell division protein FtsL
MKPKFILLGVLILISVYGHYRLKNEIVMTSNENFYLEKELRAELAIYRDLEAEAEDLQSYSNIVTIAAEEHGMIFSHNDPENYFVVYSEPKYSNGLFALLDHIIPSADAITIIR